MAVKSSRNRTLTQFKNAYAVNGVGDATRVSIETIIPVTEAQLVELANAVLAGMQARSTQLKGES